MPLPTRSIHLNQLPQFLQVKWQQFIRLQCTDNVRSVHSFNMIYLENEVENHGHYRARF